MASNPPGGGSILPDGWTWSDVGHAALDVAGLVPVIGEPADLLNAAWLANEGNYLEAGLSLIAMVPVVGDAIGKGGKLLKRAGGKLAGPALDALAKMDFEKALGKFRNHPKLGPHIDRIIEALEKWRDDLLRSSGRHVSPNGMFRCPKGSKPTSGVYDAMNPGPLPPDLAETFAGGRYREAVTTEDIVVKRVGNANEPKGRFFSTEQASSSTQARMDRAIPPTWTDKRTGAVKPAVLDTEHTLIIPKGTKIYVGETGYQSGSFIGGKQQIVIPDKSVTRVVSSRKIK